MANNRKNIRNAVVALLSGNTSAGANVYANRETSLWSSELPAILISNGDEESTDRDASGRQKIRTLNLNIEIKIAANETVDDDLDDLAAEVEDILNAEPTLTATAISSTYRSTQIALSSDGETEIGSATLTYEVKYIG